MNILERQRFSVDTAGKNQIKDYSIVTLRGKHVPMACHERSFACILMEPEVRGSTT